MEYLEVAGEVKCRTHRYHYQDKARKPVFRYDNAPHHAEISTHPHHKHAGSTILASRQPSLAEVMNEILRDYFIAAR